MKVLRFSHYINISSISEFSKNKSGYGRSVWDISRFSSKKNEELLFTYNNRDERFIDNVLIIENNPIKLIKCFNFESVKSFFKYLLIVFKLNSKSFYERMALLHKSVYFNYLKKIIMYYNPDIIHVHGLNLSTVPFIKAALDSKKPTIVTLHGLNAYMTKDEFERKFELEAIKQLNDQQVIITVVGSGMKKTILENLDIKYPDLIKIVNNGIDPSIFNLTYTNDKIREEFKIKETEKVILYVGSLTKTKNQIALIEALLLFDKIELSHLKVFIIGNGSQYEFLNSKIHEYKLTENVILTGQIDVDTLSKYYTIADITVLLSKVEGFGRPILESYLFGVPVITYGDLDAVDDIYIDGGLFKIDQRSPEAIYRMIQSVLNKSINKENIIEKGNNKTWNIVVKEYCDIYEFLIRRQSERGMY